MIDEQSSASGHDYASDRSAIRTGYAGHGNQPKHNHKQRKHNNKKKYTQP